MNKNLFFLGLVLVVSVLVLGVADYVTKPVIMENKLMESNQVELQIFPEADSFKQTGEIKTAYSRSQPVGYLVEADSYGYSSEIKVLVGFNPDKTVREVKVLEQMETPGLGTKIENKEFLSQFSDPTKRGVDAITGATISSNAVISAVDEARKKIIK